MGWLILGLSSYLESRKENKYLLKLPGTPLRYEVKRWMGGPGTWRDEVLIKESSLHGRSQQRAESCPSVRGARRRGCAPYKHSSPRPWGHELWQLWGKENQKLWGGEYKLPALSLSTGAHVHTSYLRNHYLQVSSPADRNQTNLWLWKAWTRGSLPGVLRCN